MTAPLRPGTARRLGLRAPAPCRGCRNQFDICRMQPYEAARHAQHVRDSWRRSHGFDKVVYPAEYPPTGETPVMGPPDGDL